MNPIISMHHSENTADELFAASSRLTKREELRQAIHAQELVIAGAQGVPGTERMVATAEKKLAELKEQLKKLEQEK